MKREDVLISTGFQQVNDALRQFNRTLSNAFGQVVYALDTVIEKHNDLEQRNTALEHRLDIVETALHELRDRMNGHDK